MKTFITPNPNNTQTGYDVEIVHDNGTTEVLPITKITHDGISLILPENPSNRKFWSISRLGTEPVELTFKASKTLGPRTSTPAPKAPTKGLADYLDGDDKELYLKLVEKAERNMKIAQLKAEKDNLLKLISELESAE